MMDVMEARRTKITPSSGHPGESRDPGGNAARLVTCTEDYVRPRPLAKSPYEASPSWIPDQVRDDGRWEDDGRRGFSLLDPGLCRDEWGRDDRLGVSRTIYSTNYSTSKVTPWP